MTIAYTPTTWAEQLLTDVNSEDPGAPPVPIDANTVGDILHWMPAEEGVSDWYDRNNPLNASAGTTAADGTGSYPDLSTGAAYTASMIDQQNMSSIRNALAADQPIEQASAGIVESPWASSHYGVAAAGAPAGYVVAGRGLDYLAGTAPGGGSAPASAGSPGQVPIVTGLPGNGASSTETGATAQTAALNANPFDLFGVPQTIAGSAASSIWSDVGPFAVKAILVVAGLTVGILGIWKAANPGSSFKQEATSAAPLAAL